MDLRQLEAACEIYLSAGGDAATRAAAQQEVLRLGQSVENISVIQSLFENSTSNYAIVAAALSFEKLVTEHWNTFSDKQRVDIRELPEFRVVQSLVSPAVAHLFKYMMHSCTLCRKLPFNFPWQQRSSISAVYNRGCRQIAVSNYKVCVVG
jgi:hypothetical protein